MSLECPTTPLSNTSVAQKLKSQSAAKICRYGNAKLRDILREKCMIRAREARQNSFSHCRPNGVDKEGGATKFSINEFLRQELAELEHDIELQDAIYNELIDEFNEWFAQEWEEEANYLAQVGEDQHVVCPLCQVNNLVGYCMKDKRYNYRCKCSANFFAACDSLQLQQQLTSRIDEHEKTCLAKLGFFINPQTTQLEAICDSCDYLSSF